MSLAPVFRALGDETRLKVIENILQNPSCRIGTACEGLGISRQGARKHLQILEEANVIELFPSGRDVIIRLNPEAIAPAVELLEQISARWDKRLNALKQFVESMP